MLKYSLAATVLMVVGLTACLDDDPVGPECLDLTADETETRGDTVVVSNSGLRYIETDAGAGATAESCGSRVMIDYSLSLVDGTEVEDGQPPAFRIGEVQYFPAFEQGIIGMQVGGTRRLILAPELGYGSTDVRDRDTDEVVIPGNSTLIFDIELLGIQ